MLAVVGGVLPTASEVTGLRIIDKCKKGAKQVYRLEVWYTADADAQGIRNKFQQLLSVNNEIKTKRHSNKPAVQQLTKQKTNDKDPNRPQVLTAPKVGREKEARALLAKLTPERFERLMPQLRGLLADGVVDTLDAVVVCVNQCMLQTVIFHKMYAELAAGIPSVQVGVVRPLCLVYICLSHKPAHTHTHTHSLSLVLVAMMKSKELKTKIYSHAHSLILTLAPVC